MLDAVIKKIEKGKPFFDKIAQNILIETNSFALFAKKSKLSSAVACRAAFKAYVSHKSQTLSYPFELISRKTPKTLCALIMPTFDIKCWMTAYFFVIDSIHFAVTI